MTVFGSLDDTDAAVALNGAFGALKLYRWNSGPFGTATEPSTGSSKTYETEVPARSGGAVAVGAGKTIRRGAGHRVDLALDGVGDDGGATEDHGVLDAEALDGVTGRGRDTAGRHEEDREPARVRGRTAREGVREVL